MSLNLNVLDKDQVPGVMSLRDALQAFLDHRHEVLIRKTNFRLNKIIDRLDVLNAYLIAFLNLDEVIRIIREEDQPKEQLIESFKLSDRQAEAILNMRLRALRKLEEFQLRKEFDDLTKEKADKEELLEDEKRLLKTLANEVKDLKKEFDARSLGLDQQ